MQPKYCNLDERSKEQCRRTCLLQKRMHSVDFGIMLRSSCGIMYNVTERPTQEMVYGAGRTRKNEKMADGRDVMVVRIEGTTMSSNGSAEVQDAEDAGQLMRAAILENNVTAVSDLLSRAAPVNKVVRSGNLLITAELDTWKLNQSLIWMA